MSELTAVPGTATGDLVLRALDAASMRHLALSANIANATTEGWQPLKVSFEERLAAARNALLDRDDAVVRRALHTLHPEIEAGSATDRVRLDEQVALLMENGLRYQALLTALSKSGSMLKLAIREGRQ